MLTNETNYFNAELGLAQARLNELLALVDLYRNLVVVGRANPTRLVGYTALPEPQAVSDQGVVGDHNPGWSDRGNNPRGEL